MMILIIGQTVKQFYYQSPKLFWNCPQLLSNSEACCLHKIVQIKRRCIETVILCFQISNQFSPIASIQRDRADEGKNKCTVSMCGMSAMSSSFSSLSL